MYGGGEPRRRLIEPPFHLESQRYQTVQAADWIAALVGRMGAFRAELDAWPENEVFGRYFGRRLAAVQVQERYSVLTGGGGLTYEGGHAGDGRWRRLGGVACGKPRKPSKGGCG